MNMKTEICSLFKIDYPIVQAGMAGGITTSELVAAVSEAGGLGTLGAGYLTPETTRNAIMEIRTRTDRPFAVNLFKVEMLQEDDRTASVQQQLLPIYEDLDITPSTQKHVVTDYYEEQFDILIEEKVPVITTTFGVPTDVQVKRAHQHGINLVTMVTTVKEAIEAEEAGVDAVVAQGGEAGGHRGTFDVKNGKGAAIGTFALIPQVVDHVSIPVIAAGGIMDGRGLVAARALGAEGIQLGTRFLNATESGTDFAYKKALLESDEESTELTAAFSGRPARAIRNQFVDFLQSNRIEPLNYPIQNLLTKEIRAAAKQQGKPGYMSLWSGQGNRLIKEGQTAEEIIKEIMDQASSLSF
ncbi:nitronate monooxygenase family protein [Bacillus sp. Marseille-Q3570]|uniref:NAD(P)H-dependent flavin oxidoreductase n=1 Tax=Bacillus sp. Marseille-Q3570 TaxID=2963522 RepID=UPI0021B71D6E|nr:nitronate monooxygenase family protein [Bacillus sp. Marseille-Q3570]